jgi:hypothetical protein
MDDVSVSLRVLVAPGERQSSAEMKSLLGKTRHLDTPYLHSIALAIHSHDSGIRI